MDDGEYRLVKVDREGRGYVVCLFVCFVFFFFQAEDGIRDRDG